MTEESNFKEPFLDGNNQGSDYSNSPKFGSPTRHPRMFRKSDPSDTLITETQGDEHPRYTMQTTEMHGGAADHEEDINYTTRSSAIHQRGGSGMQDPQLIQELKNEAA